MLLRVMFQIAWFRFQREYSSLQWRLSQLAESHKMYAVKDSATLLLCSRQLLFCSLTLKQNPKA